MENIGIIHTKYKTLEGMPIQSKGAADSIGEIILRKELQDGLLDLDGFSHIYLIYRFHLSKGYRLRVKPFLDKVEHGVFATRAPKRPIPIGLSLVKLLSVKENIIMVQGVDMVDGTPLLDIKPYIERFDKIETASDGWVKASAVEITEKRADDRFKQQK